MNDVINLKDGKRFSIKPDEGAESPRDWDNVGIMVCFHNRYELGDKHDLIRSGFSGWNELRDYLEKEEKAIAIMPLYLYDHSGLALSVGREYPFNDRWDSMQIGFIYTTAKRIKEAGISRKAAVKVLEREVSVYNQYLAGDVWGFVLEEKCDCCGNYKTIDSVSGFYGSNIKENGMLENLDKKIADEIREKV